MKKKFLVLGSNSFSGSNFINFLLNKKCRVVGISRSNEYKKIYLPYKKSLNIKFFKFYKIDINKNIDKLKIILKKFKPDYVVNYIAQGMVAESWERPENWYNTNVVSQVRLYRFLSNFKFIKKFIHVTTPEVYGSKKGMINESYNFNPSTPYAISRATTDTHLRKYFENFKLPIIFTRTANVYGPYQQIYRIVPKTLLFSRLNKKINLHGGGTSKRSFIYIDDASDATYKISLSGKTGDTYHISTEKIITIKNLVKKISHITKKNLSDLALISKDRIGKDYSYHLNIKKIKKELNWEAKVDLNSGLLKTLSWIDKNLNILKKEKFQYIHKK